MVVYFLLENRRQAHLTSMRLLASRAENLENEQPITSTLLAIEALSATKDELPLPDAEQVIRNHMTPYSRVLTGHQSSILAVAFSSDNRYLVTAGRDTTARLWRLDKEALIELACAWAGRDLSEEEWRRYGPDQEYHETCKAYPIP